MCIRDSFWDKWSALADKSIFGAAERFFAELSENNQKLLVERAVTLYDGRAFRKEPDEYGLVRQCGPFIPEVPVHISKYDLAFVLAPDVYKRQTIKS